MKYLIIIFAIFIQFFLFPSNANAQMMRNPTDIVNQPEVTPTQQDLSDIQNGQSLFNQFQNKKLLCNQLTDSDFEKIGEYIMNESFNNDTNAHIQMNNRMKLMMGDNAEEQMHIRLGKNATGCNINNNTSIPQSNRFMMYSGFGNMMAGWTNGNYSLLSILIKLFILADLVLLGVWLFNKNKKVKKGK